MWGKGCWRRRRFVDVLLLTLLDAIHVALIPSLKSHVETRSLEGSELASNCPRYSSFLINAMCRLSKRCLWKYVQLLHRDGGESAMGMGKKIFIGTLPQEASVEDLCWYFGRFGHILNVYIPKEPKRSGHMGFGFVTFAEDGVADCVSRRSHEICRQRIAKDISTPIDDY
ncbi:putative RNA recognition motif domain, nucleotide-binding alpha-beta plait domain superfamily [Helianthus annuus]|nr:putative RNA recognition motif domain, nucleotide-binding alpha-beta plait domain superfamily [Helianthus annuus]KAJ0819879.1 putative RNA recognition motif domain, nucleotide-binding alpha-beta plait domain superfamily [Helianthus annuus]KAJ0834435.1 putative RNA recognition motif domain, nucleotide-binding alpha-beta plait domain superfamily [Helianthus annuus]